MKKLIPGCRVWFADTVGYEKINDIDYRGITYTTYTDIAPPFTRTISVNSYWVAGTPIKIQYPFEAYLDAI